MLGVNNNIGNLRAQDAMSFNHRALQTALERLSTGVRVNRAEDDASGLVLRDRFSAQVGGLEEAVRNIQTAQGMVQIAEEGLNKITDSLQQMRQLAVRAADDNLTDKDRSDIQEQIKSLLKEVNDRAEKTTYNGRRLLSGDVTEAVGERRSTAEVQTNAFLRDGSSLMELGLQYATNATTHGAVSQGSYEVKLVYADNRFEGGLETSLTNLTGMASRVDNFSVTSALQANITVYDRTGLTHQVDTRIYYEAGEWRYQISGTAADGWMTSFTTSGTMQVNTAGQVENLNNSLINTTRLDITIDDGTSDDQVWTVDFNSSPAAQILVNESSVPAGDPTAAADGLPATAMVTISGGLTYGADPAAPATVLLNGAAMATISLTYQTGNTWNYTIESDTGGGINATVHTGTVIFNDLGTVGAVTADGGSSGATTATFSYDTGGPAQDITFDFAAMGMYRAPTSLANSLTGDSSLDGGAGSGPVQVDAAIYWTDGGSAPVIVSTLHDVSGGQMHYAGGGIVLTVNTVSTYDAGLAGYGKTLTYVSASSQDSALQYQTGSDEGEVFRVGIEKMTVDHLFRRDFYQGESDDPGFGGYTAMTDGSISLATHLQAQDLIGQIDDALRIVGRANLRVGAFKNEFDRTLDQQRANHTQMTNAYADVNDADMAVEATNQSKRNILIQSGTAMIAQANTSSQFVLQLLR